MPLNKLENFIKNVEGRILYVNPNDLDATDSITNQGNSLTKPFKTIQRALIESARFSYQRGTFNDRNDQTTILVYPGEHVIDNRPGYGIVDESGAKAVKQSNGARTDAGQEFALNLESNLDLTQEDNVLYKFNSVYGGVIIPRGTSIVGLELRKTKIRPLYVPNPTDIDVKSSSIFRLTGNCFFWQFSLFDANESGLVYTDPRDFSINNRSKPTFSHHKLTCFEYVDGVNPPSDLSEDFALSDLDMYYAKLSNAFGTGSDREIEQKFPDEPYGFTKERPEWEIVGAFANDPVTISSIISGDGATPTSLITVTTSVDHGLTVDTPIKIRGVAVPNYNISTKVQTVQDTRTFTYVLPAFPLNLPASPSLNNASVTIETDTVKGSSPYIFNVSLRSTWGMNGMHADGSKASGFRSMVVAQFTGVSLQKDDRAFVKYNESSRTFDKISITKETGTDLSTNSSSTNPNTVYHLDSGAVYRSGWESTHIKISNDAFIQVVSVFAIGYNRHFFVSSGGDASITNSNSNFGQTSLVSEGFRNEAFDKDDHAYITSIVTPRSIIPTEQNIDWISLDVGITTAVGISSHLYLFGFNTLDDKPPVIVQGYRVGARHDDKLYVNFDTVTGYGVSEANIYMLDNAIGSGTTIARGTNSSKKEAIVSVTPNASNNFNFTTLGSHNLNTGEKIKIISDTGDIPEGLIEHSTYYVIKTSNTTLQVASSETNAKNGKFIRCYLGTQLKIQSRVSDKAAGELGSPIQFDPDRSKWFIHVNQDNQIYQTLRTLGVSGLDSDRTKVSFIKRVEDTRSLDEKIYKVRVVIPKESVNAKNPDDGFIFQESSSTASSKFPTSTDFTLNTIDEEDYSFNRNPRFISTCSVSSNTITVVTELPHNLKVDNIVLIKNVTDNGISGDGAEYNGKFKVTQIVDDKTFRYSTTDVFGIIHNPGSFTNNVAIRNDSLPRFERSDVRSNYYIYRNETISPYIYNVQDGIYHIYALKSDARPELEFTEYAHSQNIVDLYPQLDKDNYDDNPIAAKSYSKRNPVGDVVTNDLKRSITRESIDTLVSDFGSGITISSAQFNKSIGIGTITFDRPHGLSGIVTCTIANAGTLYTPASGIQTYHNVKLYNDINQTVWNGATARILVSNGSLQTISVVSSGSSYVASTLYPDNIVLGKAGAGTTAQISVTSTQISSPIGNVIQTTGIGTATDGYYRITNVVSPTQVAVAMTTGDPDIVANQYALNVGPSISINSVNYSSVTGIATINCTSSHGLVAGNSFRIVDSSNNALGDFVVFEKIGINTFTSYTYKSLSAAGGRVYKKGLSANDAISDAGSENIGARMISFYDNETATLGEDLAEDVVGISTFSVVTTGSHIVERFPLGSYIQIDDEIMRIKSRILTGLDKITVIRGYFGTNKSAHSAGSIIKKVKPIPIEFRRPSIIRASGHTFEYLGYGPGNYSTGLPQVQNRTLTEREDFLSQSQERSCGAVIYTGMNSRGDFFIGNKKVTSATGEEKTYDAPIPTVTGEDPSRLSVVFDEVVIKERLKVEGGKSKTILSQFDGPVTFNNNVKIINSGLEIINGDLTITGTTQSTNKDTGAIVVEGGIGVEKNVNIGGSFTSSGSIQSGSSLSVATNASIGSTISIGSHADIGGSLTALGNARISGITTILNKLDVSGIASVTGLSLSTTTNSVGDIYSTGGPDRIFTIANVSNSGITSIIVKNSGGTDVGILTVSSALATINGELRVTGDITAFFSSDERLKDNIKPIPDALEKVISISGNTFDWNSNSSHQGKDVGVIAQEIEKVLPEIVTTRDNGYKAVQYEKIVPLLIEAIKELKKEIDELKNK